MNSEWAECQEKQDLIKKKFKECVTLDDKYQKIITLGRNAPPLEDQYKVPKNIVPGCQSVMYLHAWKSGGRIYYKAQSEALISNGLAQLLIDVYSGLPAEVILKCPPIYLEELDISASLSPNRASGLYSVHLKLKQEALRLLIESS